ncbi:unnamed protein product [Cladocopium goreaui]|uniref:Uncharacterized protein n=1 Tax=Cladocopium goreaui TaxID=2562237 RepID=A0A9P1DLP9_9DINO|nr:unnamed protein product [Cladocopium goreaui]
MATGLEDGCALKPCPSPHAGFDLPDLDSEDPGSDVLLDDCSFDFQEDGPPVSDACSFDSTNDAMMADGGRFDLNHELFMSDTCGFDLLDDTMLVSEADNAEIVPSQDVGFGLQIGSSSGGAMAGSGPLLQQSDKTHAPQCCYQWALRLVDLLLSEFGFAHLQRSWANKRVMFSSYFSGIGGLEVALEFLNAAWKARDLPGCFVSVSACEKNPACRRVLEGRNKDGHLQRDVMHNFVPDPTDKLARLQGFQARKAFFENLKVVSSCPCCGEFPRPEADMDVTGSPCQPFSSDGVGMGREDPRIVCLIAYSRVHRARGTKALIHENVERFEAELLSELFPEYRIFEVHSEPSHCGFPFLRRPRVYHLLVREDVQLLADPVKVYSKLAASLQQHFSSSPSWAWITSLPTESDLLNEENAARACKHLDPVAKLSPSWSYLLTEKQQGYLAHAAEQWWNRYGVAASADDRCVVNLGDNPAKRRVPKPGPLMTFKHNAGILWLAGKSRWLTARERAAAMSFPVYSCLAEQALLEADNLTRSAAAVGNSFHVANVGLVIVSLLLSLGHPLPPAWPR